MSKEEEKEIDEAVIYYMEKINQLIATKYQARRFLITEGTDCYSFYLRSLDYWQEFAEKFPDQIDTLAFRDTRKHRLILGKLKLSGITINSPNHLLKKVLGH